MKSRVLVDTGPLVAILRRNDQHHSACVTAIKQIVAPLLTCWPVITEAMWLLKELPEAQDRLMDGFSTGLLQILPLDESSAPSLIRLRRQYASLKPQLADLCIVHLAHREKIKTIFTLDRRDFTVYQYQNRAAFRLLPKL